MDLDILGPWNPWWTEGAVPTDRLGRPREAVDRLRPWLERPEIVTLVGVRRSGKTTIAHQLVQRLLGEGVEPGNILMVNLEDPRLRDETLGDVLSAYKRGMGPSGRMYIFLDEVQASKGWERWVLADYEQKKDVRFVVTGSSSSLVRGELATLLTGRTMTFPVHPLSFREFLDFRGVELDQATGSDRWDIAIHHLERYLEVGGFPAVALAEDGAVHGLLAEYYDTIMYRDVVRPHGVPPERIEPLVAFLMANIGTPHSLTSLKRATGHSIDTIKAYLRYLEEAHLLLPLGALTFKTKPKARERAGSKYYCIDTGLRNAVAERHSPDAGWLAENAVFLELRRRGKRLSHWKGAREVDFIEGLAPGARTPIDVCYGSGVPEREHRGIEEFRSSVKGRLGDPLVLTRDRSGSMDGVRLAPLWRWLLEEE